jgi:hypothetical protein
MAISSLWPKPLRWPIQSGTVDPSQRWVWHTRPRFILPLWEHASAGAAQRYVRLAQTRRTARAWQLNAGVAAMPTRYGPSFSIPMDDGAEIDALAGRAQSSPPPSLFRSKIGCGGGSGRARPGACEATPGSPRLSYCSSSLDLSAVRRSRSGPVRPCAAPGISGCDAGRCPPCPGTRAA